MLRAIFGKLLITCLLIDVASCSKDDLVLKGNGPIPDGSYYVAPWGNDTASGTYEHPWATWQKAFLSAEAGDVVYFRGGVYYPSAPYTGNNITIIRPKSNIGHNGQPGNPICYYNYPGETPILDCSHVHTTGNFLTGIELEDVSWVNWRGLTLRNVYQRVQDIEPKGIVGMPVSNMKFENMTVHNISGAGWYMHSSVGVTGSNFGWDATGYIPYDTTTYVNCDVYNCCDTLRVNPTNHPGNMADGFKHINIDGYITYYGCRAWNCSDDGFDIPGCGRAILQNCWSLSNGAPFINKEGDGYKFGANNKYDHPVPRRVLINCLAAFNAGAGFFDLEYFDYYRNNSRVYNCTSYNNKVGISISDNSSHPNSESVYKNNIVFGSKGHDSNNRPSELDVTCFYTESHNTWKYFDAWSLPYWKYSDSVTVENNDFQSMIPLGLYGTRKADGSLPDVSFLKLVNGSDLAGMGYSEKAPALSSISK